MSPNTRKTLLQLALIPLSAAVLVAAGCSGSTATSSMQSNAASGPSFVIGTDAPMASVASFSVQVESLTATDSSGNSVSLLSNAPTVDFARFNGLQTLLDATSVPAGTYNSITITLNSTGTIGYLNTSGAVPAISTMTATISPVSTTVSLSKPLVVVQNGSPVGIRLDFDLAKSIAVDSTGNITGAVTPTFDISTVARTDTGAHIDRLVGSVVTVPSTTTEPGSFVITGPHGQNFTINTTSTTDWDGDASLSTLTTSSIVMVAGSLNPAAQTLDADEVVLLSNTGFYADGLVTYVTPSSGAATSFDFYVRSVLPASTGVQLGDIAQVNLVGTEKFYLQWMRNPMTQFLFNSSSLTPGQEIAVGGKSSDAANESAVTVKRIHLEHWGYNGTVVAGSQNATNGSFKMKITGFAGQVVSSNVTVYMGPMCDFRYGFGAFNDLSNGARVRVVGLLLRNPTDGSLVMLARHVDSNNFTNFSTTNWQ